VEAAVNASTVAMRMMCRCAMLMFSSRSIDEAC
jgi:hypothetical protein